MIMNKWDATLFEKLWIIFVAFTNAANDHQAFEKIFRTWPLNMAI